MMIILHESPQAAQERLSQWYTGVTLHEWKTPTRTRHEHGTYIETESQRKPTQTQDV